MKVIILGNGFDLSNGLKTSYDDFFNYRIPKVKQAINEVKKVLNEKFPAKEDYNTFLQQLYSVGSNETKGTWKRMKETIYKEIDEVDGEIKIRIKKIFEKENVCFWDLYFYKLSQTKDFQNEIKWSDIEKIIQVFVMDNSINEKYSQKDLIKKLLYPPALSKNPIKSNVIAMIAELEKNILYSIKQEDIQFLIEYIILDNSMNPENDIYKCLLKNLEKFEMNFQKYINKIYNELMNNMGRYHYTFGIIANNTSEPIYIVNFNYTSISTTESFDKYSTHFNIKIGHVFIPVIENNVHGRFNTNIIFGIDQSGLKPTDKEYIFSKTYRKMRSNHTLNNDSLPNIKEVSEIIFYGHSLSEADYSYFQSIFDFYDIYNSNIVLSFKYCEYGDIATRKKCLAWQIDSITKLLGTYGESMDNKKHGENLSHKLILENRLHIDNVTEDIFVMLC